MCAVLNIAPASVYLRDVGWSMRAQGTVTARKGSGSPREGNRLPLPGAGRGASPGLTARRETSVAACARGAHYSAREGGKPKTEGLTHLPPGTCRAQELTSASNARVH